MVDLDDAIFANLLTTAQVAERKGIRKEAVYEAVKRGEIHIVRQCSGGPTYYDEQEIRRWRPPGHFRKRRKR